ncbi:MAG TPA: NYN domain-containing protein [Gemmata sp.]|nr:NYN domain-containing protein [Gemmata sp.]
MKPHRVGDGERSLAVFIDFENMGLGFNNRRDRFEISKVLERLVEKGKIVAKKAYADWSRFGMYTGGLHEAAIELVEIPRRGMSGKNSADIRLVVDAIDLAYSKDHIDTFVIVSGDSDFSPLVSKLKELGKHVIGLGLVDATSDLLRDNCDEFIYYEDLDRAPIIPVAMNEQFSERKRKVFSLVLDSLLALRRENKEVIYSSMLKDTMKRKKPSFNEEYFGYRTFSELLEDAQREGLLEIEKHKSSGMYVVTRFGLEMSTGSGVIPHPRNGNEPRKIVELPKVVVLPITDKTDKREPIRLRGPDRPLTTQPPPIRPPVVLQPPQVVLPDSEEQPPISARPLGRELVEDIDDLDDDADVPSYTPAKPIEKPAPPPKSTHRTKSEPAQKAPRKAASKPSSAKQSTPKPSRSTGTGRGRSSPKQALPPPKPVEPPPPPKPFDDDDFGAGLET